MKNKNELVYLFLNLLILLSVIILPFFRIDGGVSDDTFNYISIANSLPHFTTSVWPIGYPLIIRVVNFFFNDYYLSTRAIAVSGILFIMVFSYYKNFFYKETSILLGLKVFTIFMFSYSETLFLPFFYVLIYQLFNFLQNKKNKLTDLLKIALIFTILCIIRYSSVFLLGGLIILLLFEFIKKNRERRKIFELSLIILFSIIAFNIFFYFNYVSTGGFLGENQRGESLVHKMDLTIFIGKVLGFSFVNAMNPVFNAIRVNKLTFVFSALFSFISFSAIVFFIIKTISSKKINQFRKLLLYISFATLLGLIYSSFTTGIDGLHLRLALPIYFCIYFFIIISLKKIKMFFVFCAFASICCNALLIYNESFNYLEKRNNVKKFLSHKKDYKYYWNDVNIIPTETGGTKTSNFFSVFCVNPSIIVVNSSDITKLKNDELIIESDLVKIAPRNWNTLINSNIFSK